MANGIVLMRQDSERPEALTKEATTLRAVYDRAARVVAEVEATGRKVGPQVPLNAATKVRKVRQVHAHAMRVRGNRKRSAPGPGIEVMGKEPKRTQVQLKADKAAHRKRLKAANLKPLATGVLVRRKPAAK